MALGLIGTSPSIREYLRSFLHSFYIVKNPITQIPKTLFYALQITLALTEFKGFI